MSPLGNIIKAQILKFIRNYAPDAFSDFNLQRILLLLLGMADAAGGGGPIVTGNWRYTSANFIDPGSGQKTDVQNPLLDGVSYSLFWNEGQKYLEKDLGEFIDIPGGGFRVTIAGFDASTDSYHFYAELLTT